MTSKAIKTIESLTTVHQALESCLKGINKAELLRLKLEAESAGTYTSAMKAAQLAGNLDTFKAEWSSFEDKIRGNVDGIAKACGCSRGKDSAGKYKDTWTIPSSFMAVKSVIIKAFEHGVPLVDEKGAPRSYNAVKTEKESAVKAAKVKELEGDALVLHKVNEVLGMIQSRVTKLEGKALAEVLAALQTVHKALPAPSKDKGTAKSTADSIVSEGEAKPKARRRRKAA